MSKSALLVFSHDWGVRGGGGENRAEGVIGLGHFPNPMPALTLQLCLTSHGMEKAGSNGRRGTQSPGFCCLLSPAQPLLLTGSSSGTGLGLPKPFGGGARAGGS